MQSQNINFDLIIKELLDNKKEMLLSVLSFSDISPENLKKLQKIWLDVHVDLRRELLLKMGESQENDTLLDFSDVARMALDDPDELVREKAVRLLWDMPDKRLADRLINIMKTDAAVPVRAAAATALGMYVYEGEMDELPETVLSKVVIALLEVEKGADDINVRRHALEALGFSSLDEVNGLIQAAFESDQRYWQISALFAMGRSADDARWETHVLSMLDHADDEIQFQAIQAAGELGLKKARGILLEKVETYIEDDDIWSAAIWSLSQIGGDDVREILLAHLETCEDEETTEFLESALENLDFSEQVGRLAFFGEQGILDDFDEDDFDDFDDFDDTDDDDDEDQPSKKVHKH